MSWTSIALFYFVACAISWPFFWWSRLHPDSYDSWALPDLLKGLPFMWGPGIAALLLAALARLRGPPRCRHVGFFGGSVWRSAACYFLPILALSPFGIEGDAGSFRGATLIAISCLAFVQVLGEELGWRWWLQNTLAGVQPWRRYLVIGLLWELWHARLVFNPNPLGLIIVGQAFMLFATIGLAFLIGWAVDRTRSLMVAVTLHSWVNLPLEFPEMATLLVLAGSLPLWGILLWTWPRPTAETSAPA